MTTGSSNRIKTRPTQLSLFTILAVTAAAAMLAPDAAMAYWDGVGDAKMKVCDFFSNGSKILNAASAIVVTVAVIFSGYQIAFAHKRISDIAPALIGGVVIGAAAQIAKLVVNNDESGGCSASLLQSTMILLQAYA